MHRPLPRRPVDPADGCRWLTKYYSNTVREGHLSELSPAKRGRRKSSNSFAFTSWWADATNQPITELADFTRTFFAKHTLLNILTRYCVFDVDRKLLVMRPYQIVAAERLLQRIATATNHRQLGTVAAGGYIWHTTGSGKTLTSFKAAQLARALPEIDKVLFVVDRKDLDYQTMAHTKLWKRLDAKNPAKGYGTIAVGKTWCGYETWLNRVREECEQHPQRYRSIVAPPKPN